MRGTHRLLWGMCLFLILSHALSAHAQNERHFIFTYEAILRNLPESVERVELWLPVPKDNPEQKILSLEVDSPINGAFKKEEIYGNQIWYAGAAPPPDGTWRVTQRIEVVRKEQHVSWNKKEVTIREPDDLNLFLKSNRMVPLSSRFDRIASEETHGQEAAISQSRSLYDYVMERMAYDKSGEGWGLGDADYACDIGKGNCTDYHSLFIALTRSLAIPGRFWIGFPLPAERGEGRIGGYHCWAEFWTSTTGWVPVDISEADKRPEKNDYFFGTLDENRLVFSLGRDLILNPPQKGPPINFFIYPYAEVDGTPWDQVEYRFSYRDLP